MSVERSVGGQHVLSVELLVELVLSFGQGEDLLLTSVFSRCKQELFMVRILLQMLNLLLAVQHLPTLDAEHFSVRLCFDDFQFAYEVVPLGGANF